MESMNTYSHLVAALRSRATAQIDASRALGKALSIEAKHLRRQDQARCLDDLRNRVAQEVAVVRWIEAAASHRFNKATLINGVAGLAIGTLLGVALRTQEHPLFVGAKLAAGVITQTIPHESVAVVLGPGGVPDEVKVIALSRYAQKQSAPESQGREALQDRGYCLMTPEAFLSLLDKLKEKVLEGVVALPVASASFLLKPGDGDSE